MNCDDKSLVRPLQIARIIPEGSVLFPLFEGQLLLSRDHALFCRIPGSQVNLVQAALRDPSRAGEFPNDLLAELARHGFGMPPRSAPPVQPSVQLQLTNECNLNCAYCCTNSGLARSHEVSQDQLFQVVDEARKTMGPHTRFGLIGGEPFVVPWAIELAEYICELGSPLVMFSNGLRLGEPSLLQRVAALVKRGAELRISLAGVTRQQCDSLSGAARFDLAIAVINSLDALGVTPFVDVMLMPQAVDAAAEYLPNLRAQLPASTPINFGILYRGGKEQGAHLFESHRALEAALDRIAFEAGEVIPGNLKQPIAQRREGCTCALGHHLHVRSDGALFGCFKMVECLGHLAKDSFADLAKSAQARSRPARALPFCKDCALATLCGGGCRTENLELTGDPETPVCGEWRKQLCAELMAEDRPYALEWSVEHLLAEARLRGIATPSNLGVGQQRLESTFERR
jgi:radical SAM protein with 4Fe4S-binding SPASM domain